ncbi:hypothetical protein EJB05_14974, partial [Eragrostis curvula]
MSSSSEATSSAEGQSPPPCAGCKHLRRRCVPSCAFAAYFPPEHGDQFAAVHKVFGASNVSKLLAEVAPGDRAGAVESLVYEARARLRDPAFGCVSYITVLEHMLKQGMADVAAARGQLAAHVGAAAAFRPFDAARASPKAKGAGNARLEEALRFAKEQDDKMRAVRVAVEAKREQDGAVAWKDAVKRGQGKPLLNRQMAEAQQAAAAAQSAREQAMQIQQAQAVAAQQHGHRAEAQHVGIGLGFPDGHPRQQMEEAPGSAAAAQAAREQAMMMRQAAAAAQQHGTGLGRLAFPDGHYAAMGREHPHSCPRTALQMAHAQQQEMMLRQAAAAEELTGDQNMLAMMQPDAAELTRDANVMMLLQQAVGGHGHPDLHPQTVQQIANAHKLSAAAEVAREQGMMMMQQQGESYAHGMSGATSMAFVLQQKPQPQPQTVNALGFQTGSSQPQQQKDGSDEGQSSDLTACTLQPLPPWLADVPRRQQQNYGGDDDGQLSDLTAYFGIPGPNLPPDSRGSS